MSFSSNKKDDHNRPAKGASQKVRTDATHLINSEGKGRSVGELRAWLLACMRRALARLMQVYNVWLPGHHFEPVPADAKIPS